MNNLEIKNKIIKLGGKEWNKNDISRVYITCDILNALREEVNESEFFQPVSYSKSNNKFFYDVKENAVMRTYKGKATTIEIQY